MVQQLQLMGEVVYLKADAQDLVVLDPAWLTHQQIGNLLSTQYAMQARVTGMLNTGNPITKELTLMLINFYKML